ncbi:TolC family protein [Acetohalobium arabaticum]|uniref:Outer membrane efflux protein n=1 Tax=Acetohalobium arabaticum (strain ATCC 49924 / DSM 5501 / Z-7288) TaxID=574087 RepID=D9QSF7_ACEAZ|nr:TolC family protein [Acetohalobium arabaticum]ADL13420.1 outer membrane efflux protein [Acetohalobium arabaticum DSM 5501]
MLYPRNKLLVLVISLFLVTASATTVLAKEITFKEAVKQGLKNNLELVKSRSNLHQLQRELKIIKAGSDWQVDADTEINNSGDNFLANGESEDELDELELTLTGSKTYWSGLVLETDLDYQQADLLEKAAQDSLEFDFSAVQDIYPQVPTAAEQDYIQQKLEIEKAETRLAEEQNNKVINWTADYLELLRLQKSYQLAQKNHQVAEQELAEAVAQQEIGEAGKIELLRAQAELKEREYNLKTAENDYQQARQALADELGLSDGDKLVLANKTNYLTELKEIAASFPIDLTNKTALINLAVDNSVELTAKKLDIRSAEHKLEWKKLEDKPEIDLKGSYDSAAEEWQAGVVVTYNLFDSGRQELEVENLREEAATFKREEEQLIKDIKLEVADLSSRIPAKQADLEGAEFSLAKAELEKAVAKKQLEQGLIDQLEFRAEALALQEAKINLQAAEDELLITKLELIEYVSQISL